MANKLGNWVTYHGDPDCLCDQCGGMFKTEMRTLELFKENGRETHRFCGKICLDIFDERNVECQTSSKSQKGTRATTLVATLQANFSSERV